MRPSLIIAAAAAVTTPAIAAPNGPFAKKATSPVPIERGFNKALAFTLDEKNDLLSGTISEDNTPFESSPFVGFAVDANEANAAPGGRRKKPPHFHGSGDCCKPTEKCHAYVTWMLEMQNTNGWESEAQRREANSHVECCMRQYHASCSTSMQGNTIIWRDPTKHCSPNQGSEVPQHDETEHEGEKPQEEGVKNTPVEDEGAESKPEA